MSKLYFSTEAEMLTHKAWESLRLSPPVDLYAVAKSLKIEVAEREFDESIDGIYVRLPSGYARVGLNTIYTKPLSRRRFTFAHEIGHHLFSRNLSPGKQIFFVDGKKTVISQIEKSCNLFAVSLLMPAPLLKQHYDQLSYNTENRLSVLAERFGVSNWALRRRLRELGLQVSDFRSSTRKR